MKKCYGESSATTTQFMSIILSYGKGEYVLMGQRVTNRIPLSDGVRLVSALLSGNAPLLKLFYSFLPAEAVPAEEANDVDEIQYVEWEASEG